MFSECPNCRQPLHWARIARSTAWTTWTCKSCGALLGINKARRFTLAAFCAVMPLAVIFGLRLMGMGFGYSIPLICALVFLLVVIVDRPIVIERTGVRCRQCGYDLRGQVEPRCPECNLALEPGEIARLEALANGTAIAEPRRRASSGWVVIFIGLLLVAATLGVVVATYMARRTAAPSSAPPSPAPTAQPGS